MPAGGAEKSNFATNFTCAHFGLIASRNSGRKSGAGSPDTFPFTARTAPAIGNWLSSVTTPLAATIFTTPDTV